ncbi:MULTISPECIES: DUF58 domain-containing protein [Gracilibacillus]|uniref:DUF58 domain-containing protein n=1 Tax=Gracilibacillus TaxID=74385 RepID=UPI0008265606|nr:MULTISPECIES: DUF58 domain-containing protein [Gracilibacillus]
MRRLVKEVQFILLLVLLFVFAMFQGGFVSWFLFYSMLPILLYLMVIPFYPLKKWNVTRELSDRYLATGSKLEVAITIKRKVPFPIFFLIVEESYPETLQYRDIGKGKYQYLADSKTFKEREPIKKVLHIGFRRQVTVRYVLDHLPRGEHHLIHTNITIGDAFGFIETSWRFQQQQEFFVYPAVHPMKWRLQPESLEEGNTSSQIMNDKLSNIVSGVREYIPGDRFAWIDWKTTARKDTMMTKEFEQEKDANIMVLLDMSPVAHQWLVFEAGIQWAISILYILRKKDQQVSFLTLGDRDRFFSSHQLHTQFAAVQNYLATVHPERITWMDSLQSSNQTFAKGSVFLFVVHQLDQESVDRLLSWRTQEFVLVCYITPHEQLNEQIQQRIRQLRHRHISVQIITEKELLQKDWEVTPTL